MSSELKLEDVERCAHLARIEVSQAELEATFAQLCDIFVLIEQMRAVDTVGVEPMSHGIDVSQRLRPDRVSESDQREANQACAPEVESGLYLVPKVIE
jgi:aspartyl-tRNA(Asn)/glutamyl-tRNA(Gln) amidotransferase subunit C